MDENNKDDVIKNDNNNIEANNQTIEKTETNIKEIKKDAEPNLADNITSKPEPKTEPQPNIDPTLKPEAN